MIMDKRAATYERSYSKKPTKFINEYIGFTPASDSIDTIDINDTTTEHLYLNYISKRKPVIINGVIPDLDTSKFKPDVIVNMLDSEELLVEKETDGGFGSGTKREKMTFSQFIKRLKDGEGLYLTTQYNEDDSDEIKKFKGEEEEEEEELMINDENKNQKNLIDIPNDLEFSDTDSIDFNNFEDDFNDSNSNFSQKDDDLEIIKTNLKIPLSIFEAKTRVAELVQKPLTSLLKSESLPIQPSLFSKLITQQINLWVGSSPSTTTTTKLTLDETKVDLGLGRHVYGGGISSGLHHDHADNLYIPISGHKRFTIFSPGDAEWMYTIGKIKKVYNNGVINYINDDNAPEWRELRADSAIMTEVAKWRLDNDNELTDKQRDKLINFIKEEENQLKKFETKIINNIKKDPPSFSKIPTTIIHILKIPKIIRSKIQELAKKKYPNFFKAQRITIDLKPGQMLYLPASWFHEVTSFGDEKNNIHIALNYWYSPPDHFKKVYTDDYWIKDFERTLESIKYYKQKENI